jgi:valyl-tRNA synthetase
VSIACGAPKPEASATAVFGRGQLHVILSGLLDFEEERQRLKKAIEKLEKEMGSSAKKLENRGFLEKARPEVVAEVREKVADLSGRLEKLRRNLGFFEGMHG